MRRSVVFAPAIIIGAGVLLIVAFVGLAGIRLRAEDPIYTVAQVRQVVAQRPQFWIGRTVLVRGRITQEAYFAMITLKSMIPGDHFTSRVAGMTGTSAGTTCYAAEAVCPLPPPAGRLRGPMHFALVPDSLGTSGPSVRILWVRRDPADALLATLQQIPFLSGMLPLRQQIAWGPSQVYRLRFLRDPSVACLKPICDDAVLVNS